MSCVFFEFLSQRNDEYDSFSLVEHLWKNQENYFLKTLKEPLFIRPKGASPSSIDTIFENSCEGDFQ